MTARWVLPLAAGLAVSGVACGAALHPAPPPDHWLRLGRTVGIGAIAAAVALALASLYVYATHRLRLPAAALWRAWVLGPLILPPYLAAIAWVDLLGPAGRLTTLFVPAPDVPGLLAPGWVYTTASCGVLLGACTFPVVALALSAGWRALSRDALAAAELARGRVGVAWILCGSLAPYAAAGALGAACLSMVELALPQLLRVPVQSEAIVLAMALDHDPQAAVASGLPLVGLALALLLLVLYALRRRPALVSDASPAPLEVSPAARALWVGVLLLALAPGVWFPLLSTALKLHASAGARSLWEHLHELFTLARRDVTTSLWVGVLTASCGTALAAALAWWTRRRPVWLGLVLVPCWVGFACPAPLVGVGGLLAVDWAFAHLTWGPALDLLDRSPFMVILVDLARFEALAVTVVAVGLRRIPQGPLDAAALTPRPRWRSVGPVLLRAWAPALAGGWVLLYLLSITEYAATALVVPPGASVLSVFLVNQAHYGQGADVAGLSALLLAVVVAPLLLLTGLRRWRA